MGNCCGKDAPTDQSGHKTSPNHRLQGPDPPKFMNGPPSPTTAVRDSMKGKGGGLQEQKEGEERGVRPRKEEDLCAPPRPANLPHQSPPPLEQPKGRVLHNKEDDLGASLPPPLEELRGRVLRKKENDLDASLPTKIHHQSLPPPFEEPRKRVLHKKEDDLNASLPAKFLHQSVPTLEQPRGGVSHKKEESLHASSLPAKKPQRSVPPPLEQPRERVLRKKEDDLDDSIPAKILHQSLPPPLEQPTRGVLHKKQEGLHASSPLAKMPYHSLRPTEQAQGRMSEEILHVPLPAAMPRNFSPQQQEERQRISLRSKISHTPAPPPREHRDEGGSHKLLPTKMSDSLFPSRKEERAKMLHREQDYRI